MVGRGKWRGAERRRSSPGAGIAAASVGSARAGLWTVAAGLVLSGLLTALVAGGCGRRAAAPGETARADAAAPPPAGDASGPAQAVFSQVQPADGARAAAVDGGVGNEPPGLLLRAAELAQEQGDRGTARALLELALAAIARRQSEPAPLRVGLAHGATDPDFAEQELTDATIAPSGERAALAHGRVLSVLELDGGYLLRRLAAYPERLRRVVADRTGKRLLTLTEDGLARLAQAQGEPGPSWPLLSPQDPAQPGRPGREGVYRAPWLDFSPDGGRVFLADCGVAAIGDCPLRRLRVMEAESGRLVQTFAAEKELLDYTATRDGTVALLRAGDPPRLFAASTGRELAITSLLHGAAAQACLGRTRRPRAGERAWVVSADRRWLGTLAPPAVLCVWSIAERRLAAAAPLPPDLSAQQVRLESLLGDRFASTVLLSTGERGGGRRGYVLDAQTGQRKAEVNGLAAVLPLDDGGALLTRETTAPSAAPRPARSSAAAPRLAPPASRPPLGVDEPAGAQASGSGDGALRRGVQLFRLHPDRRLQEIPGLPRLALACLFPFPDAVRGDGGRALFSPAAALGSADCAPGVIEMAGSSPARLRRLALPVRLPLVSADFIDEQRLVMIDGGGLYVLRDARVEYASPRVAAAVTRLRFAGAGQDEQLLIETADRKHWALWPATGQLRAVAPEPAPPGPAAANLPPSAQSLDGRLRAEVKISRRADSAAAPAVSWSERDSGRLRWQSALSGLPTVSALAGSPDGRFLLAGGSGGTVVWLRAADGRELVRLQLVAGGAVVLDADGRFEALGAVERLPDYVACRAGGYPVPFALCAERLRTPRVLAAALSAR